tara:strand:- start:437 stop:1210 length:774 start_codon:yes stop_codon:yes gene_type:complete
MATNSKQDFSSFIGDRFFYNVCFVAVICMEIGAILVNVLDGRNPFFLFNLWEKFSPDNTFFIPYWGVVIGSIHYIVHSGEAEIHKKDVNISAQKSSEKRVVKKYRKIPSYPQAGETPLSSRDVNSFLDDYKKYLKATGRKIGPTNMKSIGLRNEFYRWRILHPGVLPTKDNTKNKNQNYPAKSSADKFLKPNSLKKKKVTKKKIIKPVTNDSFTKQQQKETPSKIEQELKKIEDLFSKSLISDAERTAMRKKILGID